MIPLSKISAFYIYIVSVFGAINIATDGIKPIPNAILFVLAILSFGTQFFSKKKLLVVDIMILSFALLSSFGFALFVSDIIFQPIAVAIDCEGHKPSRTHYYDIMLSGFFITLILGVLFLKTHKQKNIADKIFSLTFILVLIFGYLETPLFKNLNKKIDGVSEPEYVLPSGC